ncbi:MAG: glycosyltransferase family 4 protein, partial [Patescibacteria group bacterium]
MRIILITTKLNFKTSGGSVTDLHLKAKGLGELGHEVSVITTRSAANFIDRVLPYAVYEENIISHKYIKIQKEGYRIIKKYESKADVFYLDGNNFLYSGGFYKLLGGKAPIVAFFNMKLNCWRDPEIKAENFMTRIKRRFRFFLEHWIGNPIVNRMEAFIYNTPHLAEVYYKFGRLKEKTSIVEDMVNTVGIIKEQSISSESIQSHQKSPDKIILYCSGRLVKEKGFDLVVKAFNLLKNKDKYRVIIGGCGPEENNLKKMIKGLNLEKYFSLPGWITKEEMYNNLAEAHIFIFPRWWIEYGSVVLTEAMSLGLPCIIPAGGALEWLSKGGSWPYEPDNYKDLAKKIEELENSADLRIKLAQGGIKRAK